MIEKIKYSFQKLLLKPSTKWQLKVFLSFSSLFIVFMVILTVQYLSNNLIRNERNLLTIYASTYKLILDEDNVIKDIAPYFEIIDSLNKNISFPVIITNQDDIPNYPYKQNSLNVDVDTNMTTAEKSKFMIRKLESMKVDNNPIIIKNNDNKVIMKIFYSYSNLVLSLQYFPYIAIFSIATLLVIGFFSFSNIRKNEESKIWVGMSKEAAHQLGTPLSSLLAWMEILKTSKNDPEYIDETVSEMTNDINRLNTIANRFSKIGSIPQLKKENINDLIKTTESYFSKRLPNMIRKIEIISNYNNQQYFTNVNPELFAWVLENLIKNAAESIENKNGKIEINIEKDKDNQKILIYIKDNGKGMSSKVKKRIFEPGYTTKKRGWGLGLSLCKRIIDQYHNGRILVVHSQVGLGTTFLIELPIIDK